MHLRRTVLLASTPAEARRRYRRRGWRDEAPAWLSYYRRRYGYGYPYYWLRLPRFRLLGRLRLLLAFRDALTFKLRSA